MVVVVVVMPVIAEAALAALVCLVEFVTVVIGLPTVNAVSVNVAIQFMFPPLDVLVAAIPLICAGVCRTPEKHEPAC